MEKFDLTDIPIPDRELMEINQNQVKQILVEIERLQKIANQKTDLKAAKSANKRLNNATRALADVIETPELFADYTPTKGIKYVGEGYYGRGKSFLESMQLDPKGLTGSKSTLHHNDSLKQLFNAIYHPDPNIRYRVLQGIREAKGGDIGTTLSNLSDADLTGHKLYHTDPVTGKVDWKNRGSTVAPLPIDATVDERIAAGLKSTQKQGLITSTAEASPAVVNRQTSMLLDTLETPGGPKVIDVHGNQFDSSVRTPEGIKAYQDLDVQFKPVPDYAGGSARLTRKQMTALAAMGVTTYSALGSVASAAETAGRTQLAQETGNPLDYVQAGLSGASLAGDAVGLFPPAGPVGEVVSTVADVANIGIDTARDPKPLINAYNKIKKDPLNEAEYLGKQIMGGLKNVAGAVIFGF